MKYWGCSESEFKTKPVIISVCQRGLSKPCGAVADTLWHSFWEFFCQELRLNTQTVLDITSKLFPSCFLWLGTMGLMGLFRRLSLRGGPRLWSDSGRSFWIQINVFAWIPIIFRYFCEQMIFQQIQEISVWSVIMVYRGRSLIGGFGVFMRY